MQLDDMYIPLTISSNTLGNKINFEQRVKTAKRFGFEGIGLSAESYVMAIKQGYSDEEMLRILDDNNMVVSEIECIMNWTNRDKSGENEESINQQFKEQTIFHMARLFNVRYVNCGVSEKKVSEEEHIEAFKELCDRAGNLVIAIEFMPYSGVPNVFSAWSILEKSNCKNGRLVLDAWHWNRAKHTPKELEYIGPDKIISIQLCDVLKRSYPETILRKEALHDRLSPGKGYGDTINFLKTVKNCGVRPDVISVEVMSDFLLANGINESTRINYESTINVIKEAWPELLEKL